MKKTLLLVAGIALHSMYAQVGIETTDPQATLDVNGDVRIQNSSLSDIPSHADCPCFLVVDKQGKVKRVPIDQGSGSGSSSGGGTGSGTGGSTSGGGVPSSEGGVSNPEVLKPAVVEIGWFTKNFEEIDLLVNLPNGVPYSAFMSSEVALPTIDGGTQNFRVTYPKGQVSNGGIKAKLLISGDIYTPKLIFTPAEEKEYEVTLYFNGLEQTAKLKFKATVNAVTNQEHGETFTYPVTKIGKTYIMAMNLGAQYAKEATTNPGVLKTWQTNPNWFEDYKSYGSLFQWHRSADGHELINWTSSTEGHIVNPSIVLKTNNELWPGTNADVCPSGYTPLTFSNLTEILELNYITRAPFDGKKTHYSLPAGDWNRLLRLPRSGYRLYSSAGTVTPMYTNDNNTQRYGFVPGDEDWRGFTVDHGTLVQLYKHGTPGTTNSPERSTAYSLRCIKN